jgi:F0F1-type ATP synthase membrane subunit a
MNWIVWLGLAVLVAVVAAVTGIKPKGTRPVAHSRLMGVGRFVLLIVIVLFAWMAYRAHGG